jgi:hypothetical protein
MPGKPWKREDEKRLIEMRQQGVSIQVMAERFNLKPDAIRMKLKRLGVVVQQKKQRTTTRELVPNELKTHEEALKILVGAIEALRKPGLDKLELQRLRILVDSIQSYDSVLEKFERWTEIESRFLEMDKKITELQKSQKI